MSLTEPVNVSEARRQLAAIIDQVRQAHEPVYDAKDLEEILALAEDMSDILAAEAAREEMASTGREPIPWEEVKVELGLS
jgi:PHD/YefM family antitoxin component YafN of YafNO toxin-antitoxin module